MEYNQKMADQLWAKYTQHAGTCLSLLCVLVPVCFLVAIAGYLKYSIVSAVLFFVVVVLCVALSVYNHRRIASRSKWRSYLFSLE